MTKGGLVGDLADYLTKRMPEAAPHKWWFTFSLLLPVLALIDLLLVFCE